MPGPLSLARNDRHTSTSYLKLVEAEILLWRSNVSASVALVVIHVTQGNFSLVFCCGFSRLFWPSLSSTGIWPQSMKSTLSPSHWCDSWEATGNTGKIWCLLSPLNNWNLSDNFVSLTQRGAVHRASEHSHNVHSEEGESPLDGWAV